MNPKISLLHTTARLPTGWIPAMEAFCNKSNHPENIEYILSINKDQKIPQVPPTATKWHSFTIIQRNVTSPVSGWNESAKVSKGGILMTIADDLFPTQQGWDEMIQKEIPNPTEEEVVLNADCDDKGWIINCAFLSRKYYDRYKRIYFEGYFSLCCDNEFTYQALYDNVVKNAKHLHFEHRHFQTGKSEIDEVYKKTQSYFSQGDALYRSRRHLYPGIEL